MDLIGLTLFDRPSAAVLVRDGRVIAGARESDFSRIPGDRAFPGLAVEHCLRMAKIGPIQLGGIVLAGDAHAPAPESTEYPAGASRGTSLRNRMRRWLGPRRTMADAVAAELDPAVAVQGLDPDSALAGAAFHASPFRDAAGLLLGEDSLRRFRGNDIDLEFLESDDADPTDVERAARETLARTEAEALVLGGTRATRRRAEELSAALGVPVFAAPGGESAAALGAALHIARREGAPDAGAVSRVPGPGYNTAQIRTFLRSQGVSVPELGRDEPGRSAATALAEGRSVLWFDGRSEMDDDAPTTRSLLRLPGNDALRADERDVTEAGDSRAFRELLLALEAHGLPPRVRSSPLRLPGGAAAATPPAAWAVWSGKADLHTAFLGAFRIDRAVP